MNTKIQLGILILFSLFSINSSNAKSMDDTSASALINTYVHGFMHSNSNELNHVLDNDAVMKSPRFNQVIVQTKADLVQEAQYNEGLMQALSNQTTILSSSGSIVVAKIKFRFNDFDEDIFLTAERRNDRWKITQLIKTFPDKESQSSGKDIVAVK